MNEQKKKERIEELKAIISNPQVDLRKRKQAQKELIEMFATPEPWVKQEIITICEEQLSKMPLLDLQRFIFQARTIEHPEGFPIALDVHCCMRIREGVIVRDKDDNAEAFFWDDDTYKKMQKKATKHYFIGGDTGRYLEDYVRLRNKIIKPSDGEQLSFKVAGSKTALEVFELPAEQRTAILVTQELADALGSKLIASYNLDKPEKLDPVVPGDLLVPDDSENIFGLYYRVEKDVVDKTYRPGTL